MDPTNLYLRVREKEGRLFSDALATQLPNLPGRHPLAKEWRIRADSSSRLIQHLTQRPQPLKILELGCGNGWLSNQLAQIPNTQVWGLDRKSSELAQAARLFHRPNLVFFAANIFSAPFSPQRFDIIVLASVIQYFPDLKALISALVPLLKSDGEIHILDSLLYSPAELPAARARTRAYYTTLGFPEMADHYHHHPNSALDPYAPIWLYRPNGWIFRLKRRFGWSVSPFPWAVLRSSS